MYNALASRCEPASEHHWQKARRGPEKLGFTVVRMRGSHQYLQHPDGRATVVPVNTGEGIGRGLLAKIMRDTELAEAGLKQLL